MAADWKRTQVIAWTEREGPGRPPAGPNRLVSGSLAAGLGTAYAGVLFSDTVCPEHRAWVISLASLAMISSVVVVVGLVRQWMLAPFLTLGTAGAGVAIGLIDILHAPTRGSILTLTFAILTVVAAWLACRAVGSATWRRNLLTELETDAHVGASTHESLASEPQEVSVPADDPAKLPVSR